MDIHIKLNEEQLQRLEEVKRRENYLILPISAVENEEEFMIGSISLNIQNLVDENYRVQEGFFEIRFKLGSNPNHEIIRSIAILTYTIAEEEIENVLFGEHILVNTMDGERIKITIEK